MTRLARFKSFKNENALRYVTVCCVPGCTGDNTNTLLLTFPRNIDLARQWVRAIKSPELNKYEIPKRSWRVCEKHFEDKQFQTPERKKLLRNQIPRLFLGVGVDVEEENAENNGIRSNDVTVIDLDEVENNVPNETEKAFVFNSVKVFWNDNITDVCRICLQTVDQNKFKLLTVADDDDDDDVKDSEPIRNSLKEILPEIDLNLYPDPVLCLKCTELLKAIYQLKQTSIKSENLLKGLIKEKELSGQSTEIVLCRGKGNEKDFKRVLTIMQEKKKNALITQNPLEEEEEVETEAVSVEVDQSSQVQKRTRYPYMVEKRARALEPVLCDLCGKLLKNRKHYKNHVFVHRRQGVTVQCNICGKHVPKLTYYSHKAQHRQCKICSKVFLNFKLFKKHCEIHPNNLGNQCHICGIQFANQSGLNGHLEKGHRPKHKCSICGQLFRYLFYYKRHLMRHQSKFQCITCGRYLKNQTSLQKHIRESHTSNKIYSCDICGKVLKYQRSLKPHYEHCHGDKMESNERYCCNICGIVVKYEHSLKRHIRNYHENTGEYACPICDRHFTSMGQMLRHKIRFHKYVD